MLGYVLDSEIQQYIQRLHGNGTSLSIPLLLAAAERYLLARDLTLVYSLNMVGMSVLQRIGHIHFSSKWVT